MNTGTLSATISIYGGKLEEVARDSVGELYGRIQKRAPVDTGELRRSIQPSQPIDTIRAGDVLSISTDSPYANIIEYGSHSPQAPNGHWRISIAEFQSIVSDAVRRNQ